MKEIIRWLAIAIHQHFQHAALKRAERRERYVKTSAGLPRPGCDDRVGAGAGTETDLNVRPAVSGLRIRPVAPGSVRERRETATVTYREIVYIPLCPSTGRQFPWPTAKHYAIDFELHADPGRSHDVVITVENASIGQWLTETFGPLQ